MHSKDILFGTFSIFEMCTKRKLYVIQPEKPGNAQNYVLCKNAYIHSNKRKLGIFP